MKYRRFGRKEWHVSEIGYGMWGMAGWSGSDDDQSLESLQTAIDSGLNFFDTAWAYGDGHSEQLLGKILQQNPDTRLYTATKIPPKNRVWPSRREFNLEDCYPPDYIEDYVHRSLKNIEAQLIDDVAGHSLVGFSTLSKELRGEKFDNRVEQGREVGKRLAAKAREKGIEKVVFDRGGFLYHGIVKAIADGAREGGLKF